MIGKHQDSDKHTLPETNILPFRPWKKAIPKGNSSSNHQFSGAMLVWFREGNQKKGQDFTPQHLKTWTVRPWDFWFRLLTPSPSPACGDTHLMRMWQHSYLPVRVWLLKDSSPWINKDFVQTAESRCFFWVEIPVWFKLNDRDSHFKSEVMLTMKERGSISSYKRTPKTRVRLSSLLKCWHSR